VEIGRRKADGENTGFSSDKVEPSKFDGSASWAMLQRHFQAAADYKRNYYRIAGTSC
jgi:hypothetical protein